MVVNSASWLAWSELGAGLLLCFQLELGDLGLLGDNARLERVDEVHAGLLVAVVVLEALVPQQAHRLALAAGRRDLGLGRLLLGSFHFLPLNLTIIRLLDTKTANWP